MNIKNLVFTVLTVLMLSLSGCMKTGGENTITCKEIAALVYLDNATLKTWINTTIGALYAPELMESMGTELWEGDAIYCDFSVNIDQQPYTASKMWWEKIEMCYYIANKEAQSQTVKFDTPIENMMLWDLLDNVLFIKFIFTAYRDELFVYEVTYEIVENIPVLYIRARKEGSGKTDMGTYSFPYAVQMKSFLENAPKESDNNYVKIKIKYKIEDDDEGNEKYCEYLYDGLPIIKIPYN